MTGRFALALERARQIHGAQTRRGAAIPYVAHLLGVAALVLNDGGSEDEAIAALLHDTVEDHGARITFTDIARDFGENIARIVEACTEPPAGANAGWRAQKALYVEHIRKAPKEAQRVILADKLENARYVEFCLDRWGDVYWSRFAAPTAADMRWYHERLRDALAPWNAGALYQEFNALAAALAPRLGK